MIEALRHPFDLPTPEQFEKVRARMSRRPPHFRIGEVVAGVRRDRVRYGRVSDATQGAVAELWRELMEDHESNGVCTTRHHSSGDEARAALQRLQPEVEDMPDPPQGKDGRRTDHVARRIARNRQRWYGYLSGCVLSLLAAEKRARAEGVSRRNPPDFERRVREILADAFPPELGLFSLSLRRAPVTLEGFAAADEILSYSVLAHRLRTPRAVRRYFGTDDPSTQRRRRSKPKNPPRKRRSARTIHLHA